ncbi:MAG: PKD domain-containing protein, partial [Candidatus Kaelpia imicola]|nr:PKD domain-containing protein [Candidatus Kaelpia imicola]
AGDLADSVQSHTYSLAGTYTATLTVTDDQGLSSTNTDNSVEITVEKSPPVIGDIMIDDESNELCASYDGNEACHTFSINVDNTEATYDPDGEIDLYEWDSGDNHTASGKWFTSFAHTYGQGLYIATLEVTDNDGLITTKKFDVKVDVECSNTVECNSNTSPYCVDNQCVECRSSSDCPNVGASCISNSCHFGEKRCPQANGNNYSTLDGCKGQCKKLNGSYTSGCIEHCSWHDEDGDIHYEEGAIKCSVNQDNKITVDGSQYTRSMQWYQCSCH